MYYVCLDCPDGKFGLKCSKSCSCVHGNCDKITGDCFCEDGWEGPACDIGNITHLVTSHVKLRLLSLK